MKMEIQRVWGTLRTSLLLVLFQAACLMRADVIHLADGSQVQANAIAADQTGNVYVAGTTTDPSVLTAPNVFHLETPGSWTNYPNAFVLKLDPSGVPVFLTYLGGDGWESVSGVAVDTNGSVCVVGNTTSSNYPVANALQPALAALSPGDVWAGDGFVSKLSPSGSALVFSTYFGGTGSDNCTDVKIDNSGSVVVVGSTTSTNLWTVNALQPTNATVANQGRLGPPPGDVFVARFDPSGTLLVYSTYLGGSGTDTPTALALDEDGNAYVAGNTASTNFPAQNAFHSSYPNSYFAPDIFLTKLSSNGQVLVYSTYLGGTDTDEAAGLVVDGAGNAYVAGTTSSPDFPITNSNGILFGAVASRSFVTRFNSNGSKLDFSTFLAGPGGDSISGIALDAQERLWIAGYQSALASGAYGFGFAAAISSNGLTPAFATELSECSSGSGLKAAAWPGGVWVLGTTYTGCFGAQCLAGFNTAFLLRLTGTVLTTNPAPLIHLARPADGGFWGTNTTVPIVAAATDIGGSIQSVEFYCDGQWLETITNPPYELDLKIAIVGNHTLEAVATDDLGATATSCPLHITVVTPPLNDEFEYCAPIFELGGAVTGSIHGASRELGEPSLTSSLLPPPETPSRTLWWCWLAPSNGAYTVSSEGTDFSEALAVYAGSGLNDLTLVGSQRYGSAGLLHQATFRATEGTIYFVSIGGDNEIAGEAVVEVRPANAPPNDDFENRILLTGLNPTASASNVEATTQPGENSGGLVVPLPVPPAGASVWWSWIAPISGVFSVSTKGSSFQNSHTVYTDTNLSTLNLVSSAATFNATAGTRYEIKVDSSSDSVGDIQLAIAPVDSPANDLFANAQLLAGASAMATGTTFGATAEIGEPSSPTGATLLRSVWWSWSPPTDGTYRFTAASSNSSPSLVIYSGNSISNLTLVDGGYTSPGSSIVLHMLAGVDYRIAIDSHNDSGADVQLSIEPVIPPVNDDFANRIPLTGAPTLVSGTTVNATREAGEPSFAYYPPSPSVWWSWTAPDSTNYVLQWENGDSHPVVQFFRGTELTNLTAASDVLNTGYGVGTPNQFSASAGETLQILVANGYSAAGEFTLNLDFAEPSSVPINDYFSNRVELSGADIEIQASNVGATVESGEPGASCSIGSTAWWTWTAPSNGLFTVTSSGPGVSVYTGTNLAQLIKQVGSLNGGVTLRAEAGITYQIVVGECSAPGRDFTLGIRPAHPPANDDFTNRIVLEGSYVAATGSNIDATTEAGEPNISGPYSSPSQHTVWWSWTAPASGLTTVRAIITDPPTTSTAGAGRSQGGSGGSLAIYTNSSLESLGRIAGQSYAPTTFQAVAGQDYQIQVDGDRSGIINLTLNGPAPPQPAQIASAHFSDGGLQLYFAAAPWRTNTLEFSTDLVDWYELTTYPPMTLQNPVSLSIDDQPAMFYRLRSE